MITSETSTGKKLRRHRLIMRFLTIIFLLVVMVVLGAVSAFFVGPASLGVRSPMIGSGGTAKVGTKFPTLRGYDYSDQEHLVKHPAVILIGSHWCKHCRKEISSLNGADPEKLPEGNIYFISTWQMWPVQWPPEKALNLDVFPGSTIVDTESKLSRDLGVQEVPTWIITGKDGVVVDRRSGELSLLDLRSLAGGVQKEK